MSPKVIRDPLHGNITLNEPELELLDTPHVQRLRRIKQNGLCYLVYPAMNSTRFEHSLGVMYLAGVMADHLGIEQQAVRIAGLLHDVGHCPFSHTSDEVLARMGRTHEENSARIISGKEISGILKKHGFDPAEISGLIMGKGEPGKILSSEIDVDKMDYLIRDSYYAGVAYGVIDLERIIHSLGIFNNELVVSEGGLESVESLLISRNMMYRTVYRHHAKRIAESMFKRALNILVDDGKLTSENFMPMDDIELVHFMRKSGGYPLGIMKRIDDRNLFKRVYKTRAAEIPDKLDLSALEEKISENLSVPPGYVLLDLPSVNLSEFRIKIQHNSELKSINEVSPLASALERSEREGLTFCVYTSKENVDKFKDFDLGKYL